MSGPATLLLAVLAVTAAGCSRNEPPGGRRAASSPAVVASARPTSPTAMPPKAPTSGPASAPGGEPSSAPSSMPDVFAAPPTPGLVITDAEGRRYPVDQALVTVAAGTPREEVDRIAASVRGHVVGQIVSASLYQLQVPTKTADELEVAMARLRREPRVKDVTLNLMRQPAGPQGRDDPRARPQ